VFISQRSNARTCTFYGVYKNPRCHGSASEKNCRETIVNASAHGRPYFRVITPHAALIVFDRFHNNPSMTHVGKPLNMHSSGSIKSSPWRSHFPLFFRLLLVFACADDFSAFFSLSLFLCRFFFFFLSGHQIESGWSRASKTFNGTSGKKYKKADLYTPRTSANIADRLVQFISYDK